MDMTKRAAAAAAGFALAAVIAAGAGETAGRAVERRKAVEVAVPANGSDEAVLGRPVAMALDADRLYIADALDCAVKVFSKDGRFLESFGRKGPGPGELSFPSGVAAAEGEVIVADKLNFRIQVFDRQGQPRGGFKVPFAPDRVFSLGARKLLVTGNPTGLRKGERLLHVYDAGGRLLWEGLEARTSSDPIFDTFRNMILVCPGESGDFHVIFRSGDRTILHFSGTGSLAGKLAVDDRHVFRTLDMPTGRGVMTLAGFCWAAARDRGLFYLSGPEVVDGRDLGPGRTASVVDGQGRLRAVVELPCPVHRFLVADGRMFAIDDEGDLRIFGVER